MIREQEYINKLMKRLNFNEQDALELNQFLSKMEQRIRADEREKCNPIGDVPRLRAKLESAYQQLAEAQDHMDRIKKGIRQVINELRDEGIGCADSYSQDGVDLEVEEYAKKLELIIQKEAK